MPIAISTSRIALVNSETGWPKGFPAPSFVRHIVNDTLSEITTYGMCVRAQTSALGIAKDYS